jgi:hypothetical protein
MEQFQLVIAQDQLNGDTRRLTVNDAVSTEAGHDGQVLGCAVARIPLQLTAEKKAQAHQKIITYSLEQVRYRLQKEGVVPAEMIEEAMHEWRKFMTTILYTGGPVGMISPIVDEVWHAFILFTKDYAAFCDDVFGRFIHHAPNWPGAPAGNDSGANFRDVYAELYGPLPAIWSAHLWQARGTGTQVPHHLDCTSEESDCQSEGNCTSDCTSDCEGQAG